MAGMLTLTERRNIERAAGDEVVSATVARLYKAEGNARDYSYSGLVGAIILLRLTNGSWFFKLVDVTSGRILWEQDINRDIKYQPERPFFHSFLGANCMIGFSFADESEAANFYDKLSRKDSYVSQIQAQNYNTAAQPVLPTVASIPSTPQPGLVKSNSSDSINSKKAKAKSSGGILSGRPKSKKDSKDSKKGKIDKSMISAPTNFEHVSHVGYNPKTGFSAQNIPMEWKIIFQKAGITEEQLQDKKTAKAVAKFMKQHAGEVGKPAAAPPAIPGTTPNAILPASSVSRAPPPPPPSRGTLRAPPPPPPGRAVVAQQQAPPPPPPLQVYEKKQTAAPLSLPTRAPPSLPSRSPPVIPPRDDIVSPHVPTSYSPGSQSGPPPPPPPPPVGFVGNAPLPIASSNARPVPTPAARHVPSQSAGASANTGLFDSIRQGIQLKHAPQEAPAASTPAAAPDTSDDLAGALRFALEKRIQAVAGSDSDDDSDDNDNEW
ncbi:hypothetical protein QVD99_001852 [Batrachochytrium dendrobatidis]|nr:hypothetical protein O5D80_000495 [Batrachochytrium dendrobatidis]KAK5672033.1 hypothetical protein QVD99_001852 [Batrachochytrium dendrobatidis]